MFLLLARDISSGGMTVLLMHESTSKQDVGASPSALGCVLTLAYREWVRFFRQRNRVIGALGQPILFWLLFGTGMHGAFQTGSQDYMTFYLPGTMALILLFTAIFATISIIEDRKEGFLQGVLVAPVPRWTIAAGKILGGSAIAWVQSLLFLSLALAVGSVPMSTGVLAAILILGIASFSLTALGVFFAWPMESTQGFHAIMNLVLMPLWLLSGAFFPIPEWAADAAIGQQIMHWAMRLNPMTYVIAGLRDALFGSSAAGEFWEPSVAISWAVSLVFLALTSVLAWWIVQRPAKGDLR